MEISLRIQEAEENSGGAFSKSSSLPDEQWSGLSESNRHLNLGNVREVKSNALERRHLSNINSHVNGKWMENELEDDGL
jgi:hypothetical protein